MGKILLVLALSIGAFAENYKDIEAGKYINLEKECEEGKSAKSCMDLAALLNQTNGHDLDSFFVQNFSKKACELGGLYSSVGCDQIASAYLLKAYDENTTARDYYIHMAKKYFKKSCDRRKESDCEMLKIIDWQFENNKYIEEFKEWKNSTKSNFPLFW